MFYFLENDYFPQYYEKIGSKISGYVKRYDFSEKLVSFDYLTQSSAVFSSNIEGNTINLNSFMNYKMNKEKVRKGKEIEEIENLVSAYQFAQNNELNEKNMLQCHKLSSKTLLISSKRGKYRTEPIGVFGQSGLAYLAIEPNFVSGEMKKFFDDTSKLLNTDLSVEKVFYAASMLHLRFAHIHPFSDGNGRTARLIEKWFLAQKLGNDYWKIQSEQYYWEKRKKYYDTISCGVNFYELDYSQCVDFAEMLVDCLK